MEHRLGRAYAVGRRSKPAMVETCDYSDRNEVCEDEPIEDEEAK